MTTEVFAAISAATGNMITERKDNPTATELLEDLVKTIDQAMPLILSADADSIMVGLMALAIPVVDAKAYLAS